MRRVFEVISLIVLFIFCVILWGCMDAIGVIASEKFTSISESIDDAEVSPSAPSISSAIANKSSNYLDHSAEERNAVFPSKNSNSESLTNFSQQGSTATIINISSNVVLVKKTSYFSEFWIDGDEVIMRCYLTLRNQSSEEVQVQLSASSPADVIGGLLKEPHMVAKDADGSVLVLPLNADSEERLYVNFVGEFAGTARKHDRLLPDIIIAVP